MKVRPGTPKMDNKQNPRDVALRYLSTRDRTRFEVESHLLEKGFTPEEAAHVLAYLEENHIIDDDDYCERFVRYCIEKGRGPLRIRQDLANKGISPGMIQKVLEVHYGSDMEFESALSEAEKCIFENGDKEKQKARLARRLASRGFRADVIYRVIDRKTK